MPFDPARLSKSFSSGASNSREALLRGQQINRSVPCTKCKYILMGMNAAGACPECGTPVLKTIAPLMPDWTRDGELSAHGEFVRAVHLIGISWALSGLLLVGCIPAAVVVGVAACFFGALIRALTLQPLQKGLAILPEGAALSAWSQAPFIALTCLGAGALALPMTCCVPGLPAWLIGAMSFAVALSLTAVEGVMWLNWIARASERLALDPLPLFAHRARWVWAAPLAAVALLVVAEATGMRAAYWSWSIGTWALWVLCFVGAAAVTMVINNSFLDALRQTDTAEFNGGDDEELPLLVPTGKAASPIRFVQPLTDTPIELASEPESTTPADEDENENDHDDESTISLD